MPLIKNRYGKGRVRVMRIHRDGDRQEVSQLNVKAMMEGDFARTYTHGEISTNAGGLLIWPARLMVPIGFALLALQGVSELIKRIAFLAGKGPDPIPRHDPLAAEKELAEEIRKLAEAKQ